MFFVKLNLCHCYDFPSENNGWKKYSCNPVYGDTATGSIFDPYIFMNDDLFIMFASERKTGNIIRLDSKNGIDWKKISTSLVCKSKSWMYFVNRACVININGVWHMWFTGQSPSVSSIGHATSKDLLVFIPDENPVLVADKAMEGVSVMNPCVLYDEEKKQFRMWYAAGENYEPDMIFYAESEDGVNWNKYENPVLTKKVEHKWESYKVGGCDVKKKEDGTFEMYYIGYQNVDVARICYAYSKDGIIWERHNSNYLLGPTKGSWDRHATYKPSVVTNGDFRYLWYNGRFEGNEYIGLAIHETKD